jgi:dynamin 1-like protein
VVGLDFLPRGDGVVTRCPLEMRLVHRPDIAKPWAYFGEDKTRKFTNFDEVRDEIVRLTDVIAGDNKG